jgi:hypothetical protein
MLDDIERLGVLNNIKAIDLFNKIKPGMVISITEMQVSKKKEKSNGCYKKDKYIVDAVYKHFFNIRHDKGYVESISLPMLISKQVEIQIINVRGVFK